MCRDLLWKCCHATWGCSCSELQARGPLGIEADVQVKCQNAELIIAQIVVHSMFHMSVSCFLFKAWQMNKEVCSWPSRLHSAESKDFRKSLRVRPFLLQPENKQLSWKDPCCCEVSFACLEMVFAVNLCSESLAPVCRRLPDRGRHGEGRHEGHASPSPFLSLPAPNYAQLHL